MVTVKSKQPRRLIFFNLYFNIYLWTLNNCSKNGNMEYVYSLFFRFLKGSHENRFYWNCNSSSFFLVECFPEFVIFSRVQFLPKNYWDLLSILGKCILKWNFWVQFSFVNCVEIILGEIGRVYGNCDTCLCFVVESWMKVGNWTTSNSIISPILNNTHRNSGRFCEICPAFKIWRSSTSNRRLIYFSNCTIKFKYLSKNL